MLDLNKIVLEDLENVYKRDIDWTRFRNASILITGANGLIATYIIYMFLYLNERDSLGVKVIGLARNQEKMKNKFGDLLERDDFEVIYQDVTEPISRWVHRA